jgi:hypothetical protein
MSEFGMRRLLWWSWGSIRKALWASTASIAVHGAVLAPAFVLVASQRLTPAPELAEPLDRWAGASATLGNAAVYDVNVETIGERRSPASPGVADSPPSPPAPSPSPLPPPPATPTLPAPGSLPAPRATSTSAARTPPLPKKPKAKKPKLRDHAGDGVAGAASAPPIAGEPGGGASGGSFGAAGAASVRDLGRAFTRAIPPAGQGDPVWSTLPAGDAGSIEITLDIDETGHITGMRAPEGEPPRHLLGLVKRTLALLEAGTFAIARGTVSAGFEVLRLRVRLHDGEPDVSGGGSAELSNAYERGKGIATFTQASGRRVEVMVQLVKAEAAPAKDGSELKGSGGAGSGAAHPRPGDSQR